MSRLVRRLTVGDALIAAAALMPTAGFDGGIRADPADAAAATSTLEGGWPTKPPGAPVGDEALPWPYVLLAAALREAASGYGRALR
jgi:hypothetical protein